MPSFMKVTPLGAVRRNPVRRNYIAGLSVCLTFGLAISKLVAIYFSVFL